MSKKFNNCVRKYDKETGDQVHGQQQMDFIREFPFCELFKPYWSGFSSILDIGSGNGRINQILRGLFKEVYNIDFACEIDKRFLYDNVTFIHEDFNKYKFNRKFDIISMFYSFRLQPNKFYTLSKIIDLLNKNGRIIVIEGSGYTFKHRSGTRYYFDFRELAPTLGLTLDYFVEKKLDMMFSVMYRKNEYVDVIGKNKIPDNIASYELNISKIDKTLEEIKTIYDVVDINTAEWNNKYA